MTDLITKHFGKKDIRIIDKDGNPWFVAKDVFENLNVLWQGNRSLKNIPLEWKGVVSYATPGGNQSIEQRVFRTFGTGYTIPDDLKDKLSYVGTYQLHNGNFVGHVFDEGTE